MSFINHNSTILKAYFFSWLLILLSAYSATIIFDNEFKPISYKSTLLFQSGAILILGYLLVPLWKYAINRLFVVWWSLGLMAANSLLIVLSNPNEMLRVNLDISLAVFLLSCLNFSISRVVLIRISSKPTTPWVIFCIAMLLTTLPLWLSSWVETIVTTPRQLNIVTWSSPITYLAATLKYDYFRTQWFYQNMPYGMLRYDYPNPNSSNIILVFSILVLLSVKTKNHIKSLSQNKGE